MLPRILLSALLALAATVLLSSTASAAMIPVYSSGLGSGDARKAMSLQHGDRCRVGVNGRAMRLEIGEKTPECRLSPPVVGRDLDLAVTASLLSGTPKRLRARSYLVTALRLGEGGSLVVRVFPVQRKVQVLKFRPDGTASAIAVEKRVRSVKGVNSGNRVSMRALNRGRPGNCRIVVRVNGRRIVAANDRHCPELPGRLTGFGAGSPRGANGLVASFSRLRVALPSPF